MRAVVYTDDMLCGMYFTNLRDARPFARVRKSKSSSPPTCRTCVGPPGGHALSIEHRHWISAADPIVNNQLKPTSSLQSAAAIVFCTAASDLAIPFLFTSLSMLGHARTTLKNKTKKQKHKRRQNGIQTRSIEMILTGCHGGKAGARRLHKRFRRMCVTKTSQGFGDGRWSDANSRRYTAMVVNREADTQILYATATEGVTVLTHFRRVRAHFALAFDYCF